MRVAPRIVLSPEERVALTRWARRNPAVDFRALRARIVLKAAEGKQDLEIGTDLEVHRLTVARWRRRFLVARLRGIDLRRSAGARSGRIPEQRLRAILHAVNDRNPRGNRPWSTRALARTLGVSHSTVHRVWSSHQVRPERIDTLPFRPDPALPLVPADVVGMYLRGPDRALSFSLLPEPREGTSLPSSSPVPQVWPTRQELLPNRSPFTRPVSDSHRERAFLAFLAHLVRRLGSGTQIRVVATLPGLSSGTRIEHWRARHPSVQFEWDEDPRNWGMLVDRALRSVSNRPRGRVNFGLRGEAARSIRRFLDTFAHDQGPFEWVASSRELARNEAGHRLRYDLSVTGHAGFKRPPPVSARMEKRGRPDPRTRDLARVVLTKSLRVRKGERVTIETWSETLEYANATVLEALRLGARPLLLYQDEPTYWAATTEVRPGDLASVGEHLKAALRRSDVFVSFFGPSDRERFHSLPRTTRERLSAYRDTLYSATEKAGARAVQIALGRASGPSARMYGVDLDAWRTELIDATLVSPEELHRRAIRVAKLLRTGRKVTIRHPNGTHLELGLRHRVPLISDGRAGRAPRRGHWDLIQLPAGVVQVALDEARAEGEFHGNIDNSVGVMNAIGRVSNGRWTFAGGRLIRYRYDEGQDLFAQSFGAAGVGKDRPGVLSIGLNDQISISPLLMDQGAGTVTLQIGRNDNAGGTTREYWWAWLLLRGADLDIDGTLVIKSGKLVG